MSKITKILSLVFLSALIVAPVAAVPTLQLDIVGGTYDNSDETIVTDSNTFDLVAYGVATGNKAVSTSEDHFISIALTPKTGPVAPVGGIGSFVFAGTTYDIDDMVYGTPPLDAIEGSPDAELGEHSIFETFYLEVAFNFDSLLTRNEVNTQDTTGSDPAAVANAGTSLFYQLFSVDVGNLFAEYQLHFDLYNTKVKRVVNGVDDIGPDDFAPFSHDAATRVPEPTPLVLLGLGLIALFLTRNYAQTKKTK